jgi:uridine kinase
MGWDGDGVEVIDQLAATVDALAPGRRVVVAIDGPDAAGKTTLAGAHARRMTRRGDESPEGYYEDSFDHEALLGELLVPFRAGAETVSTSWFDHRSDQPLRTEATGIPRTTALVVDGVFLMRPELRDYWDLTVYLNVPEAVSVARVLTRDGDLLAGEEGVRRRYKRRYLPGQALYRAAASPFGRADIVIDNSDPEHPVVVRWCDG